VVKRLQAAYCVSERRTCRALGFPRSTQRYRSVRNGRAELRIRLRDLAASRVRYGYRRLHTLLKREGWQVNHKLVYRLYIEEGLQMRIKTPRRHRSCRPRVEQPKATRANESWSMDFVSDRLFDGRRFRLLTLVDNFTRESLAIRLGQRFTGDDVAAVLEQLQADRGKPQSIRVDNGPEFISKSLDWWAYFNQVTLDFSRPGRPTDNPFIESFNGRLRQECLNQHWFQDLTEAVKTVEAWRIDYNEQRPHSSLGDRTPNEFAAWFAQATPERTKPIPSVPTGSRLG
jgi:putative transposase